MRQPNAAALTLARRLRELRERQWEHVVVTQAALARALSEDKPVGAATISTWEQRAEPKLPPVHRLSAYARFFCTPRSLDPEPHLIPPEDLDPAEDDVRKALERELLRLHDAVRAPAEVEAEVALRRSWHFRDTGPVTIVCPDAPRDPHFVRDLRDLRDPQNPNYTEMFSYADLDALVELFGHLRAENPTMGVFFKRASEVKPDDLSGHVVLLGGIAWNDATRWFLESLDSLPIRQIEVDDLKTGEIFVVSDGNAERRFYPEWSAENSKLLKEDVAWLCRVPNPFNSSRTLTICNGIHSRGVMGAVRCLTDAQMRDANENYLAGRFPRGDRFALLLRVRVVNGLVLSPDLQNPENRLYEWPDEAAAQG